MMHRRQVYDFLTLPISCDFWIYYESIDLSIYNYLFEFGAKIVYQISTSYREISS